VSFERYSIYLFLSFEPDNYNLMMNDVVT